MKKVAAFVYNNCKNDARVLKEAKTLVDAGYDVTIHALLDKDTERVEIRDGIKLIRLDKNPIHYRIFRALRRLKGLLELALNKAYRGLNIIYCKLTNADSKSESKLMSFKEKLFQVRQAEGVFKAVTFFFANAPLFLWLVFVVLAVPFSLPAVGLLMFFFLYFIVYDLMKRFFMIFHRPLCLYDFYKRSLREVEGKGYDYFHGHDLYTLPIAVKAAQRNGGKSVYDSHELFTEISNFTNFERRIYRKLESKLFPYADASITVNETIAKELVKRYNVKEPVVIMNCPPKLVEDNSLQTNLLLDKVNLTGDKRKVILYQGGYGPGRGLQNLVLSNKFIDNAIMIFMGWGSLEAELRALAQQHDLMNTKVVFTGPVKQNELLNYTKCADVGIIPYQFVGLNNYYCSPNKLFEYINAHIAIAASDFPELKKVIEGCKVGATFDPESSEDIARSIKEIIENEDELNEMKQNTYAAAKLYNWETESKKLLELYSKL